ncbi:MAG TPA: SAF domain-containing protein [Actinomycetes bacterium]|jgi:SAF domain
MSGPPSPAARRLTTPRWVDVRLFGGVALVLGSVAIGTRVMAAADDTQSVWAVTTDLSAGVRLTDEQLHAVKVHLAGDLPARYLDARRAHPAGYVLTRSVRAGELLPASAVARPGTTGDNRRFVTLSVQRYHLPEDLQAGEVVDVYVTPKSDVTGAEPESRLVASAVTVSAVTKAGRNGFDVGSGDVGVEISVAEGGAHSLVTAAQSGPIDLVRVAGGAHP